MLKVSQVTSHYLQAKSSHKSKHSDSSQTTDSKSHDSSQQLWSSVSLYVSSTPYPYLCVPYTQRPLTNYSRFEIHQHSPGNVFASTSLTKERIERVVGSPNALVTGHLTIRLDAVLKTVQLPAGIAHLDSGLADMDRDTFTLKRGGKKTTTIHWNEIEEEYLSCFLDILNSLSEVRINLK